ncbi:hypothetical protein ABT180_39640, partial [Streptomyces sp. NPDC001657]
MRPSVVYVHGNGNKVRSDLLKSQWDTALFGRDMGAASRMAYWAPVRYPAPLPDHRPDPLDGGPQPAKGSPAGLAERGAGIRAGRGGPPRGGGGGRQDRPGGCARGPPAAGGGGRPP